MVVVDMEAASLITEVVEAMEVDPGIIIAVAGVKVMVIAQEEETPTETVMTAMVNICWIILCDYLM